MTFGTLALIAIAGLVGPLLAWGRRPLIPVVVGELAAGLVIGTTGFRWLNPNEPTTKFLSEVGFALVMLMAGTRVPVHDRRMHAALKSGATAAVIVGVLGTPAGIAIADSFDIGHPAIWVLLVTTGSAAVVLPLLSGTVFASPWELTVMAQVTVADIATIALLPLVLEPGKAGRAALGGLEVSLAAVAVGLIAYAGTRTGVLTRLRERSIARDWGLELRLSLIAVFALAWLAVRTETSVLVAGFGAGLVVRTLGEPKRLIGQLAGAVNGLFGPLFFVVLGARLDLRALAHRPSTIALAAVLAVAAVGAHVLGAAVSRLPLAAGLIASAQLGVPAAVASIGLNQGVLTAAQASAVMLAAIVTLAAAAIGSSLLTRHDTPTS